MCHFGMVMVAVSYKLMVVGNYFHVIIRGRNVGAIQGFSGFLHIFVNE